MPPRGHGASKLEHVWTRRKLCTALATSGKTQKVLAEEFGCSQAAISFFQTRHAVEIMAIRDDATNELAGLAVANQANRIAMYEQMALKLMERVESEADEKVAAVINKTLRNIAEELGALPTRVQLQGDLAVRTNYTVNGVTPEDLT